jgi:hypothetical protein
VLGSVAVIDTAPGGNGNGRLDPNESAALRLSLRNVGQTAAANVTGRVRSGHQLLSVTDSAASFGGIAPGDSAATSGFSLFASSRFMPGTAVVCTLVVVASNPLAESLWPFELVVGGTPAPNVATIDTAMVLLSVSSNGGIGREEPGGRGQGFRVPKDFPSSLRFASFAVGNSAAWLVDHFYSQPSDSFTSHDWVTVDTLASVAPWPGDERWQGRMSDVGHPASRGVIVEQNWYQNVDLEYKNLWALGIFDVTNNGEAVVDSVYAGVLADFSVFPYADSNRVFFDTPRRAVRMQYLETPAPTAGMVLLDPPQAAALGAVDNAELVWPDSCLTDDQKFRMLSGALGGRDSTSAADWTVTLSAGPFTLGPGETRRVALAVVGSINTVGWLTACDTAQAWYDRYFGGVGIEAGRPAGSQPRFSVRPSVVRDVATIVLGAPWSGEGSVTVIDALGRVVQTLSVPRGASTIDWGLFDAGGRHVPSGVYLVRLDTGSHQSTGKVVLR